MPDRLAMRRGETGDARHAAVRPEWAARALALALAATAAISGGLVIALADSGRDGGQPEHVSTLAAPLHGRSGAHRHETGGASSHNAIAMLRVLILSKADLARLLAIPGTPATPGTAGLPESGGPPTNEPNLGAPASPLTAGQPTTSTPLRTVVTPLHPRRTVSRSTPTAVLPATGAGPPLRTPIQLLPDIVLIPPAALPAPAVIKPATAGVQAGPLIGLGLSLVMLAGLLGLRLARRPG
jgi:hypothetical protein